MNLKNSNYRKSTTYQHKLFQWLISTLENVDFIFSWFILMNFLAYDDFIFIHLTCLGS